MTESGSEVSEFLLRVRELGEKTDREDELRAKQLEQEIAEGRKRRQQLRAERARSLSPQKPSNSNEEPMRRPEDEPRTKPEISDLPGSPSARLSSKEDSLDEKLKSKDEARPAPANIYSPFRGEDNNDPVESGTKPAYQPETRTPTRISSGKRIVSGPKPPVAPKPSNLSPQEKGSADQKRTTPAILRPTPPSKTATSPTPAEASTKTTSPSFPYRSSPSYNPVTSTATPERQERSPERQERLKYTPSFARHGKSASVSSPWDRTPNLENHNNTTSNTTNGSSNNNSPAAGSFLASRSPTRHESPTRGGFIRSAMLKRENTLRSSSPGPGNNSNTSLISRNTSIRSSPPATAMKSSSSVERGLTTSSPLERSFEEQPSPRRPQHKKSSSLSFSDESKQFISSSPWKPAGSSNKLSLKDDETMPKSDSLDSISSIGSTVPPSSTEPSPFRASRSLQPGQSPTGSANTSNADSRRWSPVRQPTWLESALKKNGPPTPEQGLVRAGTLVRSPSRSPHKNQSSATTPNHSRNMSFDRVPLSSPLDLAKPSDTSFNNSKNLGNSTPSSSSTTTSSTTARPAAPPKSSSLQRTLTTASPSAGDASNGVASLQRNSTISSPAGGTSTARNSYFGSSIISKKDERKDEHQGQEHVQKDKKTEEGELPPAIARQRSLRPLPPKPSNENKPSPEAIERLRSLRKQTTRQYEPRDEVKETIERMKSGLRRSNTVQYKPRDEVKDRLLEAKNRLRGESPNTSASSTIQEEKEQEPELEKSHKEKESSSRAGDSGNQFTKTKDNTHSPSGPKKHHTFHDDLSSALSRGPPPSQPKKAHTFDSATSEHESSRKTAPPSQPGRLNLMTKKRAKGPRRRLPTNATTPPADEQESKEIGTRPVDRPPSPGLTARSASGHPMQVVLVDQNGSNKSEEGGPLNVVKNRNNAGRPKPTIRTSSRTVSSKIGGGGAAPSSVNSPPKPRTPSSHVRMKH